ncbi:MAG: UDP-4-amino-4,6-dideoxy-N-acetyl-beta-L-altrosamine N-acetyltransferase, partial [Thermotogae bacterium]
MKLSLKRITENDLELIMNWRMLPEVTKYMYTDPNLTMEDQIKWFKKISSDSTTSYWLIVF